MSTMNKFGLQALSLSLLASLGSACVGEAQDSEELVGEAAQAAIGSTGTALGFDGSSTFVDIDMGTDIPTNPVSMEVWFKTSASTGVVPLMGAYDATLANPTHTLYLKDGRVCTQVKSGGVMQPEICSYSSTFYADGSWHHAEVSVGPTNGTRVYVDTIMRRDNTGITSVDGGSSHILLGKGGTSFFSGTLDEARIFSFERMPGNVRGGAFREHPADPTYLRGTWRLNDATGTTAADSSGHNHPGVITSPSWIAEDPGAGVLNAPIYNKSLNIAAGEGPGYGAYASLWIEDEDDRLSFNYVDASTNRTNSFTLEAWVRPTYKYQTGEVGTIIGDNGTYMLSLCYSPTAGMNGVCYVMNDNNGVYTPRTTTVEVPVDAWTHLALVHSKQSPNSKARVFKNGVMELEETLNGNILYFGATGQYKYIGNQYNAGMQFYGYIDDVRVWFGVRTATEIQSFMHWQVGGANTGLRAEWHMNGLVPGMTNEVPESTTGALNNHTNGVMYGSASLSTLLSPSSQNVN